MDLVDLYSQFYWNNVSAPDGYSIFERHSRGRQWIASLNSNVFCAERGPSLSKALAASSSIKCEDTAFAALLTEQAARPIILNGIDDVITRPDLRSKGRLRGGAARRQALGEILACLHPSDTPHQVHDALITRGFDIGVSKIVAFEQQWFTHDLR